MNMWKEIAKFVSGAAAIEVINHSTLALSDILPLHFFGIFISRNTNLIILAGWTFVFLVSVYYAWMQK
jgi:hypothetical protein